MCRSAHSGAEPRECPPEVPITIKSIGEIVYELNSPLRWSGSVVLLHYMVAIHSARCQRCPYRMISQVLRDMRPRRCACRYAPAATAALQSELWRCTQLSGLLRISEMDACQSTWPMPMRMLMAADH